MNGNVNLPIWTNEHFPASGLEEASWTHSPLQSDAGEKHCGRPGDSTGRGETRWESGAASSGRLHRHCKTKKEWAESEIERLRPYLTRSTLRGLAWVPSLA